MVNYYSEHMMCHTQYSVDYSNLDHCTHKCSVPHYSTLEYYTLTILCDEVK